MLNTKEFLHIKPNIATINFSCIKISILYFDIYITYSPLELIGITICNSHNNKIIANYIFNIKKNQIKSKTNTKFKKSKYIKKQIPFFIKESKYLYIKINGL